MKLMILILGMLTIFSVNAYCDEQVILKPGIKIQPPCDGDFVPDTLSPLVFKSTQFKDFYATGYCEATL